MKKYIAIVMFVFVALGAMAQQSTENIKFLTAPKHNRGARYSLVTTELTSDNYNLATNKVGNSSSSQYYHSYGVRTESYNRVTYNSPYQVESYNVANRAPFEDVVVTGGQMRVGRGETPDDPSVPLDGGVVAMLMFAIFWIIIKKADR